jgi:DNA (cytosine-5)-methyltransferase 1
MSKPTHLDLFSGIGGFALAARWAGFRTIGFCEIEPYCRRVLAKNFPTVPIWGDIACLNGHYLDGVDLVTGGFPCQPFSYAGKRGGAADDRALWPEMFRVVSEARPAWVLGENVAGIIGVELDTVLSDLEGIGYACRTFVIPACAVDAKHRRNRVWIIGHDSNANGSNGSTQPVDVAHAGCERGDGWSGERSCSQGTGTRDQFGRPGEHAGDVAHSAQERLQGERAGREQEPHSHGGSGLSVCCRWPDEEEWFAQSGMGRVAHGVRNRVDRLKALGNAIVPQVAYQILRAIRCSDKGLQTPPLL